MKRNLIGLFLGLLLIAFSVTSCVQPQVTVDETTIDSILPADTMSVVADTTFIGPIE